MQSCANCYVSFAKQLPSNVTTYVINHTRDNSHIIASVDVSNNRYIVIFFQQREHEGQGYIITPLRLVWNGDRYYIVGLRNESQEIICFRVDRVAGCPEILDEEGLPAPKDFDIDQFINTTFHMFSGDCEQVELICDNDVMDSIIDRFGEDVTTYANDMTSFRAIVNVATTHIFYSWVFGFGGKVAIKSPKRVKEKYADMLRRALEI